MKNKKVLISVIIVLILVVAAGIGFAYFQIMQNNEEEYNEVVERFEDVVRLAEQVNERINETLIYVQEFIDTDPNVRRRYRCDTGIAK